MDAIPDEWIDKLFYCMSEFYGERWNDNFKYLPEAILKSQWQSALMGLSYEEIKRTLVMLKHVAKDQSQLPPHFLEFFHFAKGNITPVSRLIIAKNERGNPEIAKKTLAEINSKIHFKKQECSM